jgi:general secretion pathway protein H
MQIACEDLSSFEKALGAALIERGKLDSPAKAGPPRAVAAAFREGRREAIRANIEIPVIIDLDARTVRVGVEQYPTQLSRRLRLSLLAGRSEPIGGGAGQIRFFPDGTSTGGRVTLTTSGSRHSVAVDWLMELAAIKD